MDSNTTYDRTICDGLIYAVEVDGERYLIRQNGACSDTPDPDNAMSREGK